jgi:hypothetical protein
MVSSSIRERRLYTPIDESAAAKIVRQTRASGRRKVDTEKLAEDLNYLFLSIWCYWSYDLAGSRQGIKSIKTFASRITKLERDLAKPRLASVLRTSLILGGYEVGATNEDYQALGLQSKDPDTPIERDPRVMIIEPQLLAAVRLMGRWARAAVDKPVPRDLPMSPIRILIGQGIPQLFEAHFGKRFGAGTAGDRRANGPGIRFVRACLAAASFTRPDGKPYSEETIRTYRQDVKKGAHGTF